LFLETTFFETVQGKGMGKYKRKTAKASTSIYGRKNGRSEVETNQWSQSTTGFKISLN
jgi:hypothetical protein